MRIPDCGEILRAAKAAGLKLGLNQFINRRYREASITFIVAMIRDPALNDGSGDIMRHDLVDEGRLTDSEFDGLTEGAEGDPIPTYRQDDPEYMAAWRVGHAANEAVFNAAGFDEWKRADTYHKVITRRSMW